MQDMISPTELRDLIYSVLGEWPRGKDDEVAKALTVEIFLALETRRLQKVLAES